MAPKILFVVSGAATYPNSENPTGYWIAELARPHKVFKEFGFEFDFATPAGGKAAMDPISAVYHKDCQTCTDFINNKEVQARLDQTLSTSQIKSSDYVAVFFPGGHGPVFDIADDNHSSRISEEVYNSGGVIGAICHGQCGYLMSKKPDGSLLIKGKRMTCFSAEEEQPYGDVVPWLMETKLRELGCIFSSADKLQPHTVIDDRLVTGQNPESAVITAEGVLNELIRVKKVTPKL